MLIFRLAGPAILTLYKFCSPNEIVISWSAPTDVGDGITRYFVKWQAAGISHIQQRVVTVSRSATLDKLTPYTWFDIQVRAETDKGSGPWSVSLKVRTNESSESWNYPLT